MSNHFADMLTVGGKTNSLGRAQEIIDAVLDDQSRLKELYACLDHDDAWARMRAADAIEKVCRQHPDWMQPYIDRFISVQTTCTQPSILWHMAQIFAQVNLTVTQKRAVIDWLQNALSSTEIDWIVAANAMTTLVQFTRDGSVPKADTLKLLKIQQQHKSNTVIRRATKLLNELTKSETV